jgi:hypothetical protein
MNRRARVRHGMAWCGVVWCGVVWYGLPSPLFHPLTHPLPPSLPHFLIPPLTHGLTYSLPGSLTHSPTHSLYPLPHSLTFCMVRNTSSTARYVSHRKRSHGTLASK